MNTLETIANGTFGFNVYRNSKHPYHINRQIKETKYLVFPIRGSRAETPVLLEDAIFHTSLFGYSEVCLKLEDPSYKPYYTSLPSMMKYVLMPNWTTKHELIMFTEPKGRQKYMGQLGILLKENFTPIMIVTSQWAKARVGETNIHEKFILRIDPDCILEKTNPVYKFIREKYIDMMLIQAKRNFINLDVVVGDIPFAIRSIPEPDEFTTQAELLKTVHRHIDEVMQL